MNTTILNAAEQPMQLTKGQYDQINQFIESINAEREALKGNSPQQIIEFYLDYKQSRDPRIGSVYPDNKQGKTIKDCYQYILKKARQTSNGANATMLHHNIIFGWAEDYFLNDSIEKEKIASQTPTQVKANKPTMLSKEDMHKKAIEWEKQNEQNGYKWDAEHADKIAKWMVSQKKKIAEYDMDLFNNPAENPYRNEICPYINEKNPFLNTTNPYKEYLNQPTENAK